MAVTDHQASSPMARAFAVEQLSALSCATTAEMLDVIAAMDQAEDYRTDGALDMASWLVATLHVGHATARSWVRIAAALTVLPHLRGSFAGAELSFDQIAAATRFATPDTDEMLSHQLLGCSAAEIEDMARERRRRTRRDAQNSHLERRFGWRRDHELDGYRYSGFLPAAEGELVNAVLERAASSIPKDSTSGLWDPFHHRCADAFVDLCRQQHTVDPGPDPALVVVHVDDDVLRGLVEGNGNIGGLQVPLDTVRRLLCDSPVEFTIEGPDGTCIGIARAQHDPPRWLRRRIHRRDQNHCRFPGCGRKIRQIHHIEFWERDHGPTDSWNLVGLCWAHHHLVHEGGWTLKGNADQELVFTSPHGRQRTCRPPPLLDETRTRISDATRLNLGRPGKD